MEVVVYLSLALMCFSQQCFSVLVGEKTPHGEYYLIKREVLDPLYNGSILQFKETDDEIFAIHKVWNGRPSEKRNEKIKSNNTKDRIITNGCINVTDEVYELLSSYKNLTLKITP